MWKFKVSTRVRGHQAAELDDLSAKLRVPRSLVVQAAVLTSLAEPDRMLRYLGVTDLQAYYGPSAQEGPLLPLKPKGRLGRAWQVTARWLFG